MALLRAAEGCDCIAHLAAIPSPGWRDDVLFETNVTGTQYVLAAAEAHGIQKVALASTCCTFGIFFARHRLEPQYFPMDEDHPALPQDLYGLSKVLNEQTAATYTRRTGMTTVCLRLTTVMHLGGDRIERQRRHLANTDQWRAGDMWSYIDDRDAARAFRLSIETKNTGHHVLIVAARDSFSAVDVRELVRSHYPNQADQVAHMGPHDSLYRTDRAEQAIGFVAEWSWLRMPEFADLAKTA